MSGHARAFFLGTVRPTVEEFFADVNNVRRGRLAAIVLFHMADYWNFEVTSLPTDETLQQILRDLIIDCPEFGLIKDVANSSKHDRLTRGNRRISGSDQIARKPGIFEAPFNVAMFGEASIVLVTHNDGTQQPLAGIVRSVVEMWERKLR
jgi:hypothetical protein